ncbi:MAG: hypothetical protein NC180_11760, partial [Muribaculaceae bacterium]|nr:hypothetical protein [Roseburia sp.]MCM1430931.1 hypothetical protein [Muribaculaceae bacterium]MCM1493879.1 hypothetical protein [Muribaculaceae bacterium]
PKAVITDKRGEWEMEEKEYIQHLEKRIDLLERRSNRVNLLSFLFILIIFFCIYMNYSTINSENKNVRIADDSESQSSRNIEAGVVSVSNEDLDEISDKINNN